jgi:hypothetical protein
MCKPLYCKEIMMRILILDDLGRAVKIIDGNLQTWKSFHSFVPEFQTNVNFYHHT